MKRIGILTLYSENYNYGAYLQAYALQQVLKNMELDSELLQFQWRVSDRNIFKFGKDIGKYMKAFGDLLRKKTFDACLNKIYSKKFEMRINAFDRFSRQYLDVSKEKYTKDNIEKANLYYDAFIVGSDQVWNLTNRHAAVNSAFLLEFSHKPTMAYAASVCMEVLSDEQKRLFKKNLQHIDYVSVRETGAKVILQGLSLKDIDIVLDPTLLLEKKCWDNIIEPVNISNGYIFCYFLSDDRESRRAAERLAEKTGKKLVSLSHLRTNYKKCDRKFKSEKLYDVTPGQFISLIKNADVILTDSFHAMVFSTIYQKMFYVFARKENIKSDMLMRIKDFLQCTNMRTQLVDVNAELEVDKKLDFRFLYTYIENKRENSFMFLKQIRGLL